MPGWWFTIESTTTKHFIQQLKTAVEDALKAKPAVRAIMRARAVVQRFPVRQWVEDLEKLQSSAIETSHKQAAKEKRPTLDSPSTPAILETPGLLSVLQSRLTKPSSRPRPALTQAHSQVGGLSSIAEGPLLAGPNPGLGSKMGPSSRRKRPPPPLLRSTTGVVPRINLAAADNKSKGTSTNDVRRPSVVRVLSTPNLSPISNQKQREAVRTLERPTMKRSPSTPQLRLDDRKAVKLLGMQLPASGANAPNASKHQLPPINEPYTGPSSAVESPTTSSAASTGYTTPASTPASSSREQFSAQTSPTTAPSVGVANSQVIHMPRAVDMFPSWGGHYFPYGSVAVLSTSEIKEEKPDNMLQNVMPFFSDPNKEYESTFQQKLKDLNGKTSENELCIEEYLLKSEKSWFGKRRAAELGKHAEDDPAQQAPTTMVQEARKKANDDGFGLANNYKPPSGLRRIMLLKFGDWPVYSFLLAFVSSPRHTDDGNRANVEYQGSNHSRQLIPNYASEWNNRRIGD